MLIFNITYLVTDNMYDTWYKWIQEHHIPEMTGSGHFHKPQVARVLSHEPQDGTSYSVQFHVDNTDSLEQWNKTHAQFFLEDFTKKFGQQVLLFTSVLEVLE